MNNLSVYLFLYAHVTNESILYVKYMDDPLTTPLLSSSLRCSCNLALT